MEPVRRFVKKMSEAKSVATSARWLAGLACKPSDKELQVLKRLLDRQRQTFAKGPEQVRSLVPEKPPPGVDAPEFAAWTAAARVLLNLDEFITRE